MKQLFVPCRYQNRCGRIRTFRDYEVNGFGEVRNTKTGLILPKVVRKDGYWYVCLTGDDGRRMRILLHRLVLSSLTTDGSGKGMTVNHKDENKLNTNINNLEWLTQAENNHKCPNTCLLYTSDAADE